MYNDSLITLLKSIILPSIQIEPREKSHIWRGERERETLYFWISQMNQKSYTRMLHALYIELRLHYFCLSQRNFMVVRVQFATTKLQYTLRISFLIFMLLTLARLCKRLTCRGETLLNSRSSACILVVARYNFTVANLHHLHLINDPYFLVARSCL